MINEMEIRKAISLMKPDGQLFEIRIIYDNKKVMSGYFRSADRLIDELGLVDLSNSNIYITLNNLNAACYDRSQKDSFEMYSKATTSDRDVVGLEWLMVDLDPERPAGTSSTDEQIANAKEMGNRIYDFMRKLGFNKPLTAESGNGVHLLYKIELANTAENVQLVEKCLKTLNLLFDDGKTNVDMKNYNPARVCKLYGTLAQKGSNSSERPHRMSKIAFNGREVLPTDKEYLLKLCELYPKELDKPAKYNNYSPENFDIEEWMSKHGMRYQRKTFADGNKYVLDVCPFDSNHKAPDACVFKSRSGAVGFHCFHNGCSGKTWRDVRILYEPDAYEKKHEEQQKIMYGSFNRDKKKQTEIKPEEGKPVFLTAEDVMNMPEEEESFIRTGTFELDRRLRGLKKPAISVVSGLRASGKSSWLSGLAAYARQTGNNVGVFSGELSEKNFYRWLFQQVAGKSRVEPGKYEGYYNVPRKYQQQIAKWLGTNLWLYNNNYGNDFEAIMQQFEKVIEEKSLDLLILDNLMAFNISSLSENKWEAQTEFVLRLKRLSEKYHIHIMFVAHPRKAMGFLRLDDISGTGDLANAVDNAFIVHRVNNDFKRLSAQMFGWKETDPLYSATNVIEIAKDRDGGNQDIFIPLWYEPETKRLKNYQSESIVFGWDEVDFGKFIEMEIEEETPFD